MPVARPPSRAGPRGSGSMTSGPLSAIIVLRGCGGPATSPRRPPYQASSARREVPQPGSRARRKVRRLERMRRRATRLWWIRSTSVVRRCGAVEVRSAGLGPQGPVGPGGCQRRSRRPALVAPGPSTSSSPMSLRRKVRADRASTRWRTMPADGLGEVASVDADPVVAGRPGEARLLDRWPAGPSASVTASAAHAQDLLARQPTSAGAAMPVVRPPGLAGAPSTVGRCSP